MGIIDDDKFDYLNFDDFVFVNEKETGTVKYSCLEFIEALRMANKAWSNGAPFDTDIRIVRDAVVHTPVRIVHKENVTIGGNEMYCLWGLIEVFSVPYPIAIRFYVFREEYHNNVFTWAIEQPTNNISLAAIVELFEHHEEKNWADLLDG